MTFFRRSVLSLCVGLCLVLPVATASGQPGKAGSKPAGGGAGAPDDLPTLTNGFEVPLSPAATIKEMQRQEQLFEMEVTFKSMRMRWVEVTDPNTGKKSRELFWYLVYKAVNRPLPRPAESATEQPQNVEDTVPPPLFVPRFTLVTDDSDGTKIYRDVVLPQVVADINKRESRYPEQPKLQHSVAISGPVPPPVPKSAGEKNALYGVAVFRGVDPETDYFTVYMSGFSNAYVDRSAAEEMTAEELTNLYISSGGDAGAVENRNKQELLDLLFPKLGDTSMIYRKIIVQKYKRPGDRFLQTEREFERIRADEPTDPNTHYPRWIYVPESAGGSSEGGAASTIPSKPPVPPKGR